MSLTERRERKYRLTGQESRQDDHLGIRPCLCHEVTAHLVGGRVGPPRERGRQITSEALRRSHYGSDPSRGGPGKIIAVPFSLTVYRGFSWASASFTSAWNEHWVWWAARDMSRRPSI